MILHICTTCSELPSFISTKQGVFRGRGAKILGGAWKTLSQILALLILSLILYSCMLCIIFFSLFLVLFQIYISPFLFPLTLPRLLGSIIKYCVQQRRPGAKSHIANGEWRVGGCYHFLGYDYLIYIFLSLPPLSSTLFLYIHITNNIHTTPSLYIYTSVYLSLFRPFHLLRDKKSLHLLTNRLIRVFPRVDTVQGSPYLPARTNFGYLLN